MGTAQRLADWRFFPLGLLDTGNGFWRIFYPTGAMCTLKWININVVDRLATDKKSSHPSLSSATCFVEGFCKKDVEK
jgi:hypothetical protein